MYTITENQFNSLKTYLRSHGVTGRALIAEISKQVFADPPRAESEYETALRVYGEYMRCFHDWLTAKIAEKGKDGK